MSNLHTEMDLKANFIVLTLLLRDILLIIDRLQENRHHFNHIHLKNGPNLYLCLMGKKVFKDNSHAKVEASKYPQEDREDKTESQN